MAGLDCIDCMDLVVLNLVERVHGLDLIVLG